MQVTNLKAYLAQINMTLREFCRLIDCDKGYMSCVMHGKKTASRRLAKDVREATRGVIHLQTRMRKKRQKNSSSNSNMMWNLGGNFGGPLNDALE